MFATVRTVTRVMFMLDPGVQEIYKHAVYTHRWLSDQASKDGAAAANCCR